MNDFFEKIKLGRKPYIIAEIGSNHNGDMSLAKEMINSAKKCGADCVKFQSFNSQSLISKEEYDRNQKYNDSPKKHFGSLKEMVDKYYLRAEQHYELKEYCNSINIDFASSPFSNKEVDLLVDLEVPFIKVASMDINNLPFLEYIAQQNKPIVLSTGMADLGEIEEAIKKIEANNNKQIILLHCISIYPPKYEDINLKNILMLKEAFAYPVGFSDHSLGTAIPLAAIALGSCIIEKHFTVDKNLPGWDHEISADSKELEVLRREADNIYTALGTQRRIVSPDEINKRQKFRRSLLAARELKKGTILKKEDILCKRPGTGISPNEIKYVLGKRLKRDYQVDELLKWEDIG